MKFSTLAISAFIATAAASGMPTPGNVKVVNRCSYPVYLWSVDKQQGCPSYSAVVLKKGEAWSQQMENPKNADDGGISVKISKYPTCGGHDITQLEYKISWTDINSTTTESLEKTTNEAKYNGNYLDMSFVDCQTSGDCPGYKDGYFMKSGNSDSDVATADSVTTCPTYSVANEIQAAKVAYILPDDVQTKFCPINNDLSLWVCGSEAPSSDDETNQASSSSSAAASSSATPTPTVPSSTAKVPTTTSKASTYKASTTDLNLAKAAAITMAPEPEAPKAVKTVIEYVTVSVDSPVRRHTHGRRHQRIHA